MSSRNDQAGISGLQPDRRVAADSISQKNSVKFSFRAEIDLLLDRPPQGVTVIVRILFGKLQVEGVRALAQQETDFAQKDITGYQFESHVLQKEENRKTMHRLSM